MNYRRDINMICFDTTELEKLFESHQTEMLLKDLVNRGYSLEDIMQDKEKMNEVIDAVVRQSLKSKEDREIFAALDICFSIYNSKESQICFELNNRTQPKSLKIESLEQLKNVAEEKTLTDFAICSNGDLRQFQLKQYQNELTTESLFNFLQNKLEEYGNNLGEVNLLILLQGKKGASNDISGINFQELYKRLKLLDLKFKSEILICYNQENKFQVINQIYPELKSLRKDMSLPSVKWDIEK